MNIVYGKTIDYKDLLSATAFIFTVVPVILNFNITTLICFAILWLYICYSIISIRNKLLTNLSILIVIIFVNISIVYGKIKG